MHISKMTITARLLMILSYVGITPAISETQHCEIIKFPR